MRSRLFTAFAILIIITLVGVSLSIRKTTADQLRKFVNRGGELGINATVEELEEYYATHQSWDGVEQILSKSGNSGFGGGVGRNEQGRMSLHLTDADGMMLFGGTEDEIGRVLSDEELAEGIELFLEKQTVGYLILPGQSTSSGALESALLSHLDEALGRAALISGIAALVLAMLVAGIFVKPIGQLTKAASSLAKGNLDERVAVKGTQEIKTLARTFNQMADALQEAERNRKSMTADIAHELRTPLAVQKVNLEALQDGVYPLTLDSLLPIVDQNEMLTHLVQDLRTLSLAEAGELALDKTTFDVYDLLMSLSVQFKQQAARRNIGLNQPERKGTFPVYADRTRITQIISNLLQNALRYSPEGSQVYLSLDREGDTVCLKVRDTGKGIAPEALPYVFERFYKADKSRSRGETGSGLGLAIARKLAELNKGTLTADNDPQGGAVFRLTLPKVSE
ncbi:MAG: HAMP domain-containing protein [Anaerolineaceae bacterium]|nr:HAMP domain-containing protein [Anaerolineaceae bacterium]